MLALSDGTMLQAPEPKQTRVLARKLSKAKRGSNRRKQAKLALAKARVRNADALTDWAHKASTEIARSYDVIRIEDLKIANMTRSARGRCNSGWDVKAKAGLNRAILQQGWGKIAIYLEYKAAGRVEKSARPTPASAARSAGPWTRTVARAKLCSRARPADAPATLM